MEKETEHWRLEIIPRYVRKRETIKKKIVTCYFCNGKSASNWCIWDDRDNCDRCHNSGVIQVDDNEGVENRPEITKDFVEHMRKAYQAYFNKENKND